jgi:hypothetical protein
MSLIIAPVDAVYDESVHHNLREAEIKIHCLSKKMTSRKKIWL